MSLQLLVPGARDEVTTWPSEPRLYDRGTTDLDRAFTLDLVDSYIDTECLTPAQVVLAKDGKIIHSGFYVQDGRLKPGELRRRVDDGHTLSLRNLQDGFPFLARMCRLLQTETGYPCHATAYLTPPGAQGLSFHWDPYTVLVAQISGRKVWPLFAPVVSRPMREHLSFPKTGFTDEQRAHLREATPDMTFVLEPGDTLWVPRGWIHDPRTTGDEPSLHVTFAVKERTRYWLARQLLEHALTDDAFREEVAPARLTGDRLEEELANARSLLVGYLSRQDLAARRR